MGVFGIPLERRFRFPKSKTTVLGSVFSQTALINTSLRMYEYAYPLECLHPLAMESQPANFGTSGTIQILRAKCIISLCLSRSVNRNRGSFGLCNEAATRNLLTLLNMSLHTTSSGMPNHVLHIYSHMLYGIVSTRLEHLGASRSFCSRKLFHKSTKSQYIQSAKPELVSLIIVISTAKYETFISLRSPLTF